MTSGLARSGVNSTLFDQHLTTDIGDCDEVMAAVVASAPDVIVNAAAFANHHDCELDPDQATRVNVDGARNIASAASAVGARLIHVSTDAVFNGAQGDYREGDAPEPFSVYGETKLLGEMAVLDAYPSAVIARTNFFGWSPTSNRSILEFFVNSLSAGKQVTGFDDFFVTSMYVQELAKALFEIAESDFSGVVHVAPSDSLSKYEFGLAVAKIFEFNAELITRSTASIAPDGLSRSRDLSLNTEVLESIIGKQMPTQAAGVRQARLDQRLRTVLSQK